MKAKIVFFLCFCFISSIYSESDEAIYSRINRLDKHVTFLANFHKKNKDRLKTIISEEKKNTLCQLDFVDYEHELIRLCVKMVANQRSFDPVFKTWSIFLNDFRSIETSLFLKEFAVLVFFVYKNLITSLIKSETKVTSEEIFELSNRIMSLPIDQLLDILDKCCRQFMFIMQDYGMAAGVNPKEWLKNYWWVIPVSVASFIVSVVKYLFTPPVWQPVTQDSIKTKENISNSNLDESLCVDDGGQNMDYCHFKALDAK